MINGKKDSRLVFIGGFAKPFLYLSLFLIPFYFFHLDYHWIRTNIFEAVLSLALISFLISIIRTDKKIRFGSLWAILFLFSAVVAFTYSGDREKALGILKGWFVFPYILYFLTINQTSKKDFPKLILPIFIAAILVAIWGILQRLGVHYFFPNQNDYELHNFLNGLNPRIFSVFESPNYLAMYIAPVIFLVPLLMIVIKNFWARVMIGACSGFFAFILFLTNSRGGLIAVIGGIVFLAVKLLLKTKSLIGYAGIIFFVILSANLTYHIVKYNHPNSERGREKIYNYSIKVVRDYPVWGTGLGNFQNVLADEAKNDQEFLVYFLPYAYHPHNVYIAVWMNLGLLGIIAFIIFIAKFFFNLSDDSDSAANLLVIASMITILIQGIFDTTYFKNDLAAIFWLLCAFAFILRKESYSKEILGGKVIL